MKLGSSPETQSHWHLVPWGAALFGGILPLWVTRLIPFTDLPQHLYLISALGHLSDPTTLYPQFFESRHVFTSYLGYYYSVDALSTFMSVDTANRVFLSLYVLSLPLGVAFLLRTFKRPAWPALLTIPFAYGDPIAWGFINSSAAFPIAIFTAACFVRSIEDAPHRRKWAVFTAILLVLVLTFHVLSFVFLAVALPLLLLTSRAPESSQWRAKRAALVSVLPGVAMFLFWIGRHAGGSSEGIARETPNTAQLSWVADGSFLASQNIVYNGFEYSVKSLIAFPWSEPLLPRFQLFAAFTPGTLEHRAILLTLLVAVGAAIVGFRSRRTTETLRGGYRLVGLAVIAFVLYLCLPHNINGYIYVLNSRFAPYIPVFLIAALPMLPVKWRATAPWFSAAAVLPFMLVLTTTFHDFDAESRDLQIVAKAAPPRVKVMGLMYSWASATVRPPVFIHAAAEVARAQGGVPNFSFALTPQSPLKYRIPPPPTFRSEWNPVTMEWDPQGSYYDCFLLRGAPPATAFGYHLGSQVVLRKEQGSFSLYCRPEFGKAATPADSPT